MDLRSAEQGDRMEGNCCWICWTPRVIERGSAEGPVGVMNIVKRSMERRGAGYGLSGNLIQGVQRRTIGSGGTGH